MRSTSLLILILSLLAAPAIASNPVEGDPPPLFKTFQSSRVINGHSNEVLAKRMLNFRISHRFGDMAGAKNAGEPGRGHTLWGLDEARDIRFALEYGITDKLMIALGRNKGAGDIREIFDGFIKYNLLHQMGAEEKPLSLTIVGTGSITNMPASTVPWSPTNFRKFAHRITYTTQLVASRRISDRLALAVIPAYTHRNFVGGGDQNGVISVGVGGIVNITKLFSLTAEYYHTFRSDYTIGGVEYFQPLAVGIEINTGGHLFQLHLSNSGGIGENQFIANTVSNWLDGQFRFGFTVSRKFKL